MKIEEIEARYSARDGKLMGILLIYLFISSMRWLTNHSKTPTVTVHSPVGLSRQKWNFYTMSYVI